MSTQPDCAVLPAPLLRHAGILPLLLALIVGWVLVVRRFGEGDVYAVIGPYACAVSLLSMALDLLAYEWRSERIAEQVDALDGMGAPGRWLEELYAQLRMAVPSSGSVAVGG